jgi:arylsulfatase A-like enzyme
VRRTQARARRRSALPRPVLASLAAALLACGADPGPAPTGASDGASLVLVTIDTLRADHLSRGGHPRTTTPYLDRLAGEGIYFSRCFAQASWTLPSMLSLFSSLAPAVFGVSDGVQQIPKPGKPRGPALSEEEVVVEYFSERYVTLPEVLRDHGLATAGFSTNGHLRVEQGFAQGFQHFDQSSCMYGSAECAFTAATRWLDGHTAAAPGAPFFLWVHLFDPHFDRRFDGGGPQPLYAAPPGYEALFGDDAGLSLEERTRLAYDRKLRYTDDRLRDFVEALRARGLLERVVLAVAADHGEEFNEHGLWGHARSLRNTLVHVPLLVRLPGGAPRAEIDALVSNLDLAPTLLDALGIEPPAEMGGRSLLPLVRGEPLSVVPVYGETRRHGLDLRFWVDPSGGRKLVLDLATGERRLFDLGADPGERRDLAAAEPGRADALERELRAAIAEMESRRVETPRPGTLSPTELEHLRELGYLN